MEEQSGGGGVADQATQSLIGCCWRGISAINVIEAPMRNRMGK